MPAEYREAARTYGWDTSAVNRWAGGKREREREKKREMYPRRRRRLEAHVPPHSSPSFRCPRQRSHRYRRPAAAENEEREARGREAAKALSSPCRPLHPRKQRPALPFARAAVREEEDTRSETARLRVREKERRGLGQEDKRSGGFNGGRFEGGLPDGERHEVCIQRSRETAAGRWVPPLLGELRLSQLVFFPPANCKKGSDH